VRHLRRALAVPALPAAIGAPVLPLAWAACSGSLSDSMSGLPLVGEQRGLVTFLGGLSSRPAW
jgi:hypothetical protein